MILITIYSNIVVILTFGGLLFWKHIIKQFCLLRIFLTFHNSVDCSFPLSMNWEDKERFYWTCAGSKFSEESYSMYLGFSVVLVMSLFKLKLTNFLSGLYHLFSIYSSVTSLLWQLFPTTLRILMMKPLDGFHGEAEVWRRAGGVRLKQLGERIF